MTDVFYIGAGTIVFALGVNTYRRWIIHNGFDWCENQSNLLKLFSVPVEISLLIPILLLHYTLGSFWRFFLSKI